MLGPKDAALPLTLNVPVRGAVNTVPDPIALEVHADPETPVFVKAPRCKSVRVYCGTAIELPADGLKADEFRAYFRD